MASPIYTLRVAAQDNALTKTYAPVAAFPTWIVRNIVSVAGAGGATAQVNLMPSGICIYLRVLAANSMDSTDMRVQLGYAAGESLQVVTSAGAHCTVDAYVFAS